METIRELLANASDEVCGIVDGEAPRSPNALIANYHTKFRDSFVEECIETNGE